MPGDCVAFHPINNIKITFKEDSHTYTDDNNTSYISVTTLIAKGFEVFDTQNVAKNYAIKHGLDVNDVLNEWNKKGKNATRIGTRMHENAENYINGKYDLLHEPDDINEKIRFDSLFKIIDKLKNKFDINNFETEKLVFSPSLKIAGSIDLLVKKDSMNYIIFDWKCLSKGLNKFGFNNKTGIIFPTLGIQDSNYWHYAMQLGLYEAILRSEKYINPLANVQRCIIYWDKIKFNFEKMPDISKNIWQLITWNTLNLI